MTTKRELLERIERLERRVEELERARPLHQQPPVFIPSRSRAASRR